MASSTDSQKEARLAALIVAARHPREFRQARIMVRLANTMAKLRKQAADAEGNR